MPDKSPQKSSQKWQKITPNIPPKIAQKVNPDDKYRSNPSHDQSEVILPKNNDLNTKSY